MSASSPEHGSFTGLVLAGGRSRRMGVDKAFVEIDGVALAVRLARTLVEGGAREVLVIGGDADRLRALDLAVRPDLHPGEGPLGGVLTGLRAMTTDLAFVTACDHPSLDSRLPARLIERWSRSDADACIPVVNGVRQVLAALYHRRVLDRLAARFAGGERSLRRATETLIVDEVRGMKTSMFVDIDTPDDLRRFTRTS